MCRVVVHGRVRLQAPSLVKIGPGEHGDQMSTDVPILTCQDVYGFCTLSHLGAQDKT